MEVPVYLPMPLRQVRELHHDLIDGAFQRQAVQRGEEPLAPVFELAVDALIQARLQDLEKKSNTFPSLVKRRSTFWDATFLESHMAAYGVETRT